MQGQMCDFLEDLHWQLKWLNYTNLIFTRHLKETQSRRAGSVSLWKQQLIVPTPGLWGVFIQHIITSLRVVRSLFAVVNHMISFTLRSSGDKTIGDIVESDSDTLTTLQMRKLCVCDCDCTPTHSLWVRWRLFIGETGLSRTHECYSTNMLWFNRESLYCKETLIL